MTEEDRPKEEAKLKEEARMKSLQSPEEFRQTPEGRRELALKHKRHMIYGLLWIVGGATVGACTNSLVGGRAAGAFDATYFMGGAAALWGIIDFLRGYLGWRKYKD